MVKVVKLGTVDRMSYVIGWAFRFIGLAVVLRKLGLHPHYAGRHYRLHRFRAVIVTTSHAVLHKPGKVTGKATGVFSSEMTAPYYAFLDAGMEVDLASIKGGPIPVEPPSLNPLIRSMSDERFLNDAELQSKVTRSIPLEDLDLSGYDVVFFAGGWGAAYDLGQSRLLAQKISRAYSQTAILFGSVCHGALAFIGAQDQDGKPLIRGRRMTGVTQKQIKELGVDFTPLHPEEELRKAGADFHCRSGMIDTLKTYTTVDQEGRFITGQNQNSGYETAQKILELLDRRR